MQRKGESKVNKIKMKYLKRIAGKTKGNRLANEKKMVQPKKGKGNWDGMVL